MAVRALLSSRLSTPWKRLAFVVACVPAMGLAGALLASGYFYYRVYIQDDQITFFCHQDVAWRELGMKERPAEFVVKEGPVEFSPEWVSMARLANQRIYHRWSFDVMSIEQGSNYQNCLRRTYLAGDSMNLWWALTEARNFAVWTVALPLLMWGAYALLRWLTALFRWVAMR